jgi:hypothetical protein
MQTDFKENSVFLLKPIEHLFNKAFRKVLVDPSLREKRSTHIKEVILEALRVFQISIGDKETPNDDQVK